MNLRNWTLLAAFASLAMPAGAQYMQPDTTTGSMAPNALTEPAYTFGGQTDYTTLLRPRVDYLEIVRLHGEGFTDRDIAVMWEMSRASGELFDTIVDQASGGTAFITIAYNYNLDMPKIYAAADNYVSRIRAYKIAYRSTGSGEARQLVAGSRMVYSNVSGTPVTVDKDIAETIPAYPELTTFAQALQTASMTDMLRGPGPLTVFAPTNTAFARLTRGQLDSLMADRMRLGRVLQYHIIPSRIDAATAMAMTSPTSPPTLEGATLQVTSTDGTVFVNGASVVRPDILCTNGIIHEVDAVLLPPGDMLTPTGITPGGAMTSPPDTTTPPSSSMTPGTTTTPDNTTGPHNLETNPPTTPVPGSSSP